MDPAITGELPEEKHKECLAALCAD